MLNRIRVPRAIFALAGLLIAGCTSDPSAERLTGTWAAPIGIPGAAFVLDMQETNDQVSGQGCYAIEAGQAGRLTVAGTRAGAVSSLTISWYVDGQPAPTRTITFDFRLTDSGHLVGTSTDVPPTGPSMLELERIASRPRPGGNPPPVLSCN